MVNGVSCCSLCVEERWRFFFASLVLRGNDNERGNVVLNFDGVAGGVEVGSSRVEGGASESCSGVGRGGRSVDILSVCNMAAVSRDFVRIDLIVTTAQHST